MQACEMLGSKTRLVWVLSTMTYLGKFYLKMCISLATDTEGLFLKMQGEEHQEAVST